MRAHRTWVGHAPLLGNRSATCDGKTRTRAAGPLIASSITIHHKNFTGELINDDYHEAQGQIH